jgi:hypothetical protein
VSPVPSYETQESFKKDAESFMKETPPSQRVLPCMAMADAFELFGRDGALRRPRRVQRRNSAQNQGGRLALFGVLSPNPA